jgi:hypothetical protein
MAPPAAGAFGDARRGPLADGERGASTHTVIMMILVMRRRRRRMMMMMMMIIVMMVTMMTM